jgi:sugar/nucleoside kinase (ribokinase family)
MTDSLIDVVGIGNAIVDILARTDDGFLDRLGLAKGSMRLIDEDQAHALYGEMGPAVEISGGSAANTIAGIASFGGTAAFIGKVRDDQLGDVFGHDIRSLGVAFDTAPAVAGPSTARCMVLVTPDGERTLNTYLGASVGLGPEDVNADLIAGARVTYLEGYLWDPAAAKEAFVKAARLAHGADRIVALTLSDAFCVDRHRAEFRQLVAGEVDLLFANESEITSLYQVKDFDAALQAVRHDCNLAVLTRSEKGCVIVGGAEVHVVDAHRVDRVVDSTGAGDLFAAGFLFGLTHDRPLVDCGRLGALAAAEVISHIGARPEVALDALARENGLL